MTTNQKIDALDTNIQTITSKFDALAEKLDKRFENIDRRFDAIDRRFDIVDKRLEEHDEKFVAIGDAFMTQQDEIIRINQKLDIVIELVKHIPSLIENATKVNFALIAMQRKDDMILDRLSKLELA